MAYGGMTPNTFGTSPTQSNARDRITRALMRIGDPPPGGLIAGSPPALPQQQPTSPTGPQPGQSLVGAQPGMVQPQVGMPPGGTAPGVAPPPAGPMGPIGGPYAPGINLPGIQPPGQLPQEMLPNGLRY
jgi:hypothetical protein